MRYLILHNRYFHVSGPETYLFNLKEGLESMGHTVDVFSLNYTKNINNKSDLLPDPIGNKDHYSFRNQNLSFIEKFKIITSLFYRQEVYKKLNNFLSINNYDGAIVLQFWGKLSPSIFNSLKKKNIPIALRISDFGLVCGSNTLLKNGKHSEECISNKYGCIKNKCVNNSYYKSLINSLAQIIFFRRYSKNINYIFTCKNTQSIFYKAGYKFNSFHIPTFYPKDFIEKKYHDSKKIIYLGRVDEDKGIHNIISSFPDSKDIFFEIWGSGNDEYISKLRKMTADRKNKNINIMGSAKRTDIAKIFDDSMFSIVPSQWHDNLPNALIESLSNGVPVITPNYGCFPEFITHSKNGFLYNDFNHLKEIFHKITRLYDVDKKKLSLNSTMFAKETFSSKMHIERLLKTISNKHEDYT